MKTTPLSYLRAGVCSAALAVGLMPLSANAAISELVVTAQKRAESIQDVPISISAFDGDFIEDSGINTLQDLSFYAPNLYLSQSSQVANQRIAIRGVGSVGNNAIEPSVAVFIDGVYVPRPSSVVGNLQDIEAVEVLRGPQGTFFGRNASMGAINIRTKNPEDEFGGNIRVSAGNFDAYSIGATVNVPINEKAAGRFAIDYSDRDGYGENLLDGSTIGGWEDLALRGALNFTPADNWDVLIRADYQKIENGGPIVEALSSSHVPAFYDPTFALINTTDVTTLGLGGNGIPPELSDSTDFKVRQVHEDRAEDEQWGISAEVSWDIGDHTLKSITAYRDWENDTYEEAIRLSTDIIQRVTAYEATTFSQELQLISPSGNFLEYVLGAYYYDEEYTVDQDLDAGDDFCGDASVIPIPQAGLLANLELAGLLPAGTSATCAFFEDTLDVISSDGLFEQDLESYALYGQATLNLTDQFRLRGGLRWTKDEKSGSFTNTINNPIVSALGLRSPESFPDMKFDDEELTWLATGEFDVNDDIMVYATASTGYKTGGFNSEGTALPLGTDRIFGSETTTNYEIGAKSSLFDGLVTANVTVFQTTIDDFQDRSFDGISFIVRNAGELEQKGVEIDIQAQPIEQLFIALGAGYLDSEFKSFPAASALPGTPWVEVLPTIYAPPGPQDLSGERNHFSPEWQASLVSQWTDQLANSNYDYFIRGEWQYVDDQNVGANTNGNPQSIQEAYDLFNARIGLASSDGKWELSAFGRNLGDEGYCQTMFDQPFSQPLNKLAPGAALLTDPTTGGALQRCVLGSPRTYGVEAKVNF